MGPWMWQWGSIGISWTFLKKISTVQYQKKDLKLSFKASILLPAFQATAQATGSSLLKIQAGPKAISGQRSGLAWLGLAQPLASCQSWHITNFILLCQFLHLSMWIFNPNPTILISLKTSGNWLWYSTSILNGWRITGTKFTTFVLWLQTIIESSTVKVKE